MGALMARAEEMAGEMLESAPLALRLTKEGLRMNIDSPSLDAALALEDRHQTLLLLAGEEFGETLAGKRGTKHKMKRPAAKL